MELYQVILLSLLLLILLIVLIRVLSIASKLPIKRGFHSPYWYLNERTDSANNQKIPMVCIGDSITHGLVSINYLDLLAKHSHNNRFEFINAGINGDLAYNVLVRMDEIIQCRPKYATILIGTNDVHRSYGSFNQRKSVWQKHLSQIPTKAYYRECLEKIIERLQNETEAKIAVLSIPLIAERPEEKAEKIAIEYNETIRDVTNQKGVAYLPLHEKMVEYMKNRPIRQKKPFWMQVPTTIMALIQHFGFGVSLDDFGTKHGFALHIDHLHLNTAAATIVADLIQEFLDSNP
jgi:lysophospholipase L1-like esterase